MTYTPEQAAEFFGLDLNRVELNGSVLTDGATDVPADLAADGYRLRQLEWATEARAVLEEYLQSAPGMTPAQAATLLGMDEEWDFRLTPEGGLMSRRWELVETQPAKRVGTRSVEKWVGGSAGVL